MSRNIIVTGANGHLGRTVVRKFMEMGDHVIAVARSGSNLGFAENKSNFELHAVDLDNEEATNGFVNEITSLKGQIHYGLLVAGGFAMGNIETTDGLAIQQMFNKNFSTAYHVARPLFQHMMQHGYGRLVFVGARPALEPAAAKGALAYALSKSLLFQLAGVLNAEAGKKDVVTSVIAPGVLDTPPNHEAMPAVDKSGWSNTESVADLIALICSKEAGIVKNPVYKLY